MHPMLEFMHTRFRYFNPHVIHIFPEAAILRHASTLFIASILLLLNADRISCHL